MNTIDIVNHLLNFERTHNKKILYACESGSYAYGLNDEYSDHDVKVIYVAPITHYLSLRGPMLHYNETSDEIDVSAWDLRKLLLQIQKGNPSIIEWANSPVVYINEDYMNTKFSELIRELALEHFHPLTACKYYYRQAINRMSLASACTGHKRSKQLDRVRRCIVMCYTILETGTFPLLFGEDCLKLHGKYIDDIDTELSKLRDIDLRSVLQSLPNYSPLINPTSDLDELFIKVATSFAIHF